MGGGGGGGTLYFKVTCPRDRLLQSKVSQRIYHISPACSDTLDAVSVVSKLYTPIINKKYSLRNSEGYIHV